VPGRALVLVDDVMTTGATISAAAESLRRAGAASVLAVTLARADAS
jgi:predicted amidophosphoribosyltransferase